MNKLLQSNSTIANLISLGIVSSVLPFFLLNPYKIDRKMTVNDSSAIAIAETVTASSQQSEPIGDLGKTIGVTALGVGATSLIWYANKANKPSLPTSGSELFIDRVSPKLRKRLLTLVHNDRQIANRLLAGARISHPDRSIDWLADKVVYNLERDRGLY
jgi:hypothetical protein